jgi:hypothetical protein
MSGSAYHVSESNSSLRLLDSHSGSIEEAHEYAATHWFSGRRPLDTGSNSRRTEEHEKPLSVQRVSSFRCVCGGGGRALSITAVAAAAAPPAAPAARPLAACEACEACELFFSSFFSSFLPCFLSSSFLS